MVDESVDGGDGHGPVGEDRLPIGKRSVTGDDQASVLVPLGDQFEENTRFRLIFSHIPEIIEDQAVDAVQLSKEGWESEIAPGSLEALHHVVGADI